MSGDLPWCPDARHQHPAAVLEVEEVQDELYWQRMASNKVGRVAPPTRSRADF